LLSGSEGTYSATAVAIVAGVIVFAPGSMLGIVFSVTAVAHCALE
jgi:hypothetical protein